MNDDLDHLFPPGTPPDIGTLEKISAKLAASAEPVRPLPSNSLLWGIALGIFLIVSVLIAGVVKFKAFASLSAGEMFLYYGTILVLAALFARALIERMIPGERRLLNTYALWSIALVVLGALMALIFTDHTMDHFVAQGIPCLRLGVISAFISGLLGWRLFQRGYLVSPRETMLFYGFFAGLVGIAVLALHCPIRNSLHVAVWHLGAMAIAGLAGLFLGKFFEDRSYAD